MATQDRFADLLKPTKYICLHDCHVRIVQEKRKRARQHSTGLGIAIGGVMVQFDTDITPEPRSDLTLISWS